MPKVANTSGYTLEVDDQYGNHYSSVALNRATYSFEMETVQLSTANPLLFVYGVPYGAGAPNLLQGVEVQRDGETIATLSEAEAGIRLSGVPVGTALTLKREGYLPAQITTTASPILYATLQEAVPYSSRIPSEAEWAATRPLARAMAATLPAVTIPEQGGALGAVLVQQSTTQRPTRTLGVQVDPYRVLSSVVDRAGLEAAIKRDFFGRVPTTLPANWSWRVLGGATVTVRDEGDPVRPILTPAETTAAALGGYATLDPYQSEAGLLAGSLRDAAALVAEFGQGDAATGYRAEIDLYARRPTGWERVSSGVTLIDPALPTDQAGSLLTALSSDAPLEAALSGYSHDEALILPERLPLNQWVMKPSPNSHLMDGATQSGGLHDYAFVLKQLTPLKRTIQVLVTDAETGAPLPNARVTLAGGFEQISNSLGRVTFAQVALPASTPTIEIEALRHDHNRNRVALAVDQIESSAIYTVPLQRVSEQATLRGYLTDAEQGTPLAEATVRLVAPTAMANLTYDEQRQRFTAYNDPQALYHWRIRSTAATSTSRLLRVFGTDWREVKVAHGSEEGSWLSGDEVIRELITLGADQQAEGSRCIV